jgi:hypothetical protein
LIDDGQPLVNILMAAYSGLKMLVPIVTNIGVIFQNNGKKIINHAISAVLLYTGVILSRAAIYHNIVITAIIIKPNTRII